MTKYCCDLAINSSPITGKQNVLFCYWWLPLHPKTKKEKNNHKRFRWTLTKTILHLGIYEHLFISSPSCVDFISFHYLIDSKLNFPKANVYLAVEQLQFCSPQALTELKAFEGGAAHVNCCMAKTRQPQSKPCSLRFRSCLSCFCSTTENAFIHVYVYIYIIVFVFAYFLDSDCNGGVIGHGPKSIQWKTVKRTQGGKNEKSAKGK